MPSDVYLFNDRTMKETPRKRSILPPRDSEAEERPAAQLEPAMIDWQQRLLLRRYRFAPSHESETDFAARIDYAGLGFYFPLATSNPKLAAAKAEKIYQTVARQGWNAACRKFSRELMVGFEWCANPILWTYTTIHTLVASSGNPAATDKNNSQNVLIVEADAGIRRALEWCVNQQGGLCGIGCDSEKSFDPALEAYKPQMILVNRNLARRVGLEFPGEIATIRTVPALTYSCAMDGDQLFASTPGGAEGYLLKRVKPEKLFEPVLDASARPNFSSNDMPARVKMWFKGLLQSRSHPETSALAKLTPRENEVLALLSKGCVDKEIASALGISAWTVHGHVKKIFERLNVRTRTEAVVRYLEK